MLDLLAQMRRSQTNNSGASLPESRRGTSRGGGTDTKRRLSCDRRTEVCSEGRRGRQPAGGLDLQRSKGKLNTSRSLFPLVRLDVLKQVQMIGPITLDEL